MSCLYVPWIAALTHSRKQTAFSVFSGRVTRIVAVSLYCVIPRLHFTEDMLSYLCRSDYPFTLSGFATDGLKIHIISFCLFPQSLATYTKPDAECNQYSFEGVIQQKTHVKTIVLHLR